MKQIVIKRKENSLIRKTGVKLLVFLCLFGSTVYVVNEFYSLQIFWNKVFHVHYKSYSQFGIRIPTQYKVHGIDVSHHQGAINWKMVKEMKDNEVSLDFAFIKATEGISHKDTKFKYNWEQSKKMD